MNTPILRFSPFPDEEGYIYHPSCDIDCRGAIALIIEPDNLVGYVIARIEDDKLLADIEIETLIEQSEEYTRECFSKLYPYAILEIEEVENFVIRKAKLRAIGLSVTGNKDQQIKILGARLFVNPTLNQKH